MCIVFCLLYTVVYYFTHLVPMEIRRHWVPYNWSYRPISCHMDAGNQVLMRAASALDCSPVP